MYIIDRTALASSIKGRHENWRSESGNKDPNAMWISAKKYVLEAVSESQPIVRMAKRQHWMTPKTWKLIEDRRAIKASGAKDDIIREKSTAIQNACRRDRNLYLSTICEELEQHADNLQTRDLHEKVRQITRQFKPKTWAIENAIGTTVTEIQDIMNVWKEYCIKLFMRNRMPTINTVTIECSQAREPDILRDESIVERVNDDTSAPALAAINRQCIGLYRRKTLLLHPFKAFL
ncbi:unnamed protein product [Leptosia nina]|uniref:Uncharacterized protein n=1 Tax=Leptosia nina TaxID=320188 RepID=A0AAV1IYD2_9NEOP